MEVCDHTFEQSEQLSLLIHFSKATVKTAPFDSLKPLKMHSLIVVYLL